MWAPREGLEKLEYQEERAIPVIALKDLPERRAPLETCRENRGHPVPREKPVLRENREWWECLESMVVLVLRDLRVMMELRVMMARRDPRVHQGLLE